MSSRYPQLRSEKWLRYHYLTMRMSTRQIAEVIGCRHNAVNLALHKLGIPLRPARWVPEVRVGEQADQILSDFQDGKSVKEIAISRNCSILCVLDTLGHSRQEVSG